MTNPKPWEDFEACQLQLKVKRLEAEKRIRENWHSLRVSWEKGEELLDKLHSLGSGDSKNLIWGPLGRFAIDLLRKKIFSK